MTSRKSKFRAIAKIKNAFAIDKLEYKNERFPLPGRCKYKNNDKGDVLEVYFQDYAFINLPDSIADLSLLQKLTIRYSEDSYDHSTPPKHLTILPESFCNLKKLEHLDFTRNDLGAGYKGLDALPECFGNLTNLQTLTFYYNSLEGIPNTFKNLQNLLTLDLSVNNLKSFPNTVFELKKLKNLNLRKNKIDFVPDSFESFTELSVLDLGSNKLESIPNSICRLKNLKALFLDKNNLSFIPDSISNLKKLQVLNLDNNETLLRLPDSIGNLTSLQKLYLGGKGIVNIPESVANLVNLRTIGLSLNHTISFSKFCLDLPNLQKIIIYPGAYRFWGWDSIGHWYHFPPMEDLSPLPASVRDIFKELKNNGCKIHFTNLDLDN